MKNKKSTTLDVLLVLNTKLSILNCCIIPGLCPNVVINKETLTDLGRKFNHGHCLSNNLYLAAALP